MEEVSEKLDIAIENLMSISDEHDLDGLDEVINKLIEWRVNLS